MNTTVEVLYQKLKALSPSQLAEIDDFLEFIRQRRDQARQAAGQRLLEAMEKLDAVDSPPMNSREIQSEIQAVRAQKHAARRANRR